MMLHISSHCQLPWYRLWRVVCSQHSRGSRRAPQKIGGWICAARGKSQEGVCIRGAVSDGEISLQNKSASSPCHNHTVASWSSYGEREHRPKHIDAYQMTQGEFPFSNYHIRHDEWRQQNSFSHKVVSMKKCIGSGVVDFAFGYKHLMQTRENGYIYIYMDI